MMGDDVTIITKLVLVARALDAAKRLAEQGVSVRVLNMSSTNQSIRMPL